MKTVINKCDRCKRPTDFLVDIQMINQNIKEEEEKEERLKNPFSMFFGQGRTTHPTLAAEICYDCMKELCRWLEHSENSLIKER